VSASATEVLIKGARRRRRLARVKRGFHLTQRTQRNERKQRKKRKKRNEFNEINERNKRELQPIGTEVSSFQLNSFLRFRNLKKINSPNFIRFLLVVQLTMQIKF